MGGEARDAVAAQWLWLNGVCMSVCDGCMRGASRLGAAGCVLWVRADDSGALNYVCGCRLQGE